MAKNLSRADRWMAAVQASQNALDLLKSELETLRDVHQEYSDWKDNLPESLQNSAVGEKLAEVVDNIDIEEAISNADGIEDILSNAESADLPKGFGRD